MPISTPPVIKLELSGGTLVIRSPEATYQISVAGGAPAPSSFLDPVQTPAAAPEPGPGPALASAAAPEKTPAPQAAQEPEPQAVAGGEPESGPVSAAPPQDLANTDSHPMPGHQGEDQAYFEKLSREMYESVGNLARRLSMSIHDVEQRQVEDFDLQAAGDKLELAKDQLENVVKMTEQATNRIIDLGEEIQGATDRARSIMQDLGGAGPSDQEPDSGSDEAKARLEQAIKQVSGFVESLGSDPLAGVLEQAKALQDALGAGDAAPSEPEPEPEAEAEAEEEPEPAKALKYDFPLDLIFQTTYEMCTNETVKKHIKSMWDAGEKGFRQDMINQMLNAIAPEAPDEDNFLNLNLVEVMKSLFKATGVDKFKAILKKIANTADQIFLDPNLPIEAMPGKAPAAAPKPQPKPEPKPKPKPAAPAGPGPEVMARLEDLLKAVEETKAKLAAPELPEDLPGLLKQAVSAAPLAGEGINQDSRKELEDVMNVIFSSVNSIIEALSFQDLSGQAIYRIVRLLTDFQVQLLAMVVGFGIKIKAKSEKAELSVDESDRMAQEEVDKVMESLGLGEKQEEGEEAPSKLDQDSVNSLLENLGF